MRLKILLLTLAVLTNLPPLTSSLKGQTTPPPTVDKCRSDQHRWWAELEKPGGPALTYPEFQYFISTMKRCQTIDASNYGLYSNVINETMAFLVLRYEGFLRRHELLAQFVTEDLAGLR